jgi:hypothetical protein
MQYKTIMLELLQEFPSLYDQLRTSRRLLPTMESYANVLKDLHTLHRDTLSQTQPGTHPSQIASQALELAVQDLRDTLAAASSPNVDVPEEPFSLDAATAFLRRPTPPA